MERRWEDLSDDSAKGRALDAALAVALCAYAGALLGLLVWVGQLV